MLPFLVAGILAVAAFHALIMAVLSARWPGKMPNRAGEEPISVVVAARNEAARLPILIPDILSALGPNDEFLLVLDRCEDKSEAIARALLTGRESCSNVLVINTMQQSWSGKKWALQQGVIAARNPWLLFTDADCRVSQGWIEAMRAHMQPGCDVVLGLGMYRHLPGWLNRLIRFETVHTAWLYIGLARLGLPYMGVGRNLALRKATLLQTGGYHAHSHRLSGDDDLTVNALAQAHNTRVCVHPQAITWSEPEPTWAAWLHQKRRHLSASGGYRLGSLLLLGAIQGSFVTALAGILTGLVWPATFLPALASYVCRTVIVWIAFGRVAQKVQERSLIPFFPLLEIAFFCYSIFVVPIGILTQPNQWKK